MATEPIERKVCEIIALQLGVGDEDVLPESSFRDDLGADALDLVELVMALEEEFGIDISEEDAAGFEIVDDVVNYLNTKAD